MPNLVPLDFLLVLLIGAGMVGGYLQGGVRQALGLAGAAAGAIVGVILLPEIAAALPPLDRMVRAVLILAFLFVALVLGQAVGGRLATALLVRLGRGPLRTADHMAGGALGGAQVVLAIWLLAPILAVGPSQLLAAQIDSSAVVSTLHDVLPSPATMIGRLRAFLDPAGLPQVFELFEAPTGIPVATPQPAEVVAVARLASGSTVLVEGEACGLQITGTGFVVAPDYIVTNAHVVAGERRSPRVTGASGSRSATVVFFDPDLDVAVLYSPGLSLPPLPLASAAPARGAAGAALGHPNGGALSVVPAAVRDVFTASGFDIYGSATVTRMVIELATQVEPGDSGGPFVTLDGSVAGVVFARSMTDTSTGYALTAGEVERDIGGSIGHTDQVSTGSCAP